LTIFDSQICAFACILKYRKFVTPTSKVYSHGTQVKVNQMTQNAGHNQCIY